MTAFVAQLGERKTEDLKVRGSIPRGGIFLLLIYSVAHQKRDKQAEVAEDDG
jgi:hypothetical protein